MDNETGQEQGTSRRLPVAVAALTVVATVVAVLVLVIDQQIKRDIIAQVMKARTLLDEAQRLAEGLEREQRAEGRTSGPADPARASSDSAVGEREPVATSADGHEPGAGGGNSRGPAAPRRGQGGHVSRAKGRL